MTTSILNKPDPASQLSVTRTTADRHREIALYHANLIQAQKDVEAAIVAAIEVLIDFPTEAESTSDAPSHQDAEEFTKLIAPFTPADYDELIEERRIDSRCGYVFCSKPPKTTKGGTLKILGKNHASSLHITDRARAECWCSDACAQRALYIKVQLMEEPAWSRRSGSAPNIEVMTADLERERASKKDLTIDQERMEKALRDLTLERGDDTRPARAEGMVSEIIIEKATVNVPTNPDSSNLVPDAVEGFVPKTTLGDKVEGDATWGI